MSRCPRTGPNRQWRWTAVVLAAAICLAAGPARAADEPVAGTLDLGRVGTTADGAAGADGEFVAARGAGPVAAVAFAGDVDGGGVEDFAFGTPAAGGSGSVAVVLGLPQKSHTDLGRLRERGFRLTGGPGPAEAGAALAAAGDVNGDGFGDLLVGAPGTAVAGRGEPGAAYLVFGGRSPPAAAQGLDALGARGIRIFGAAAGDRAGEAVAAIGDLDGDRRGELLVGAPGADAPDDRADAGAVYVLYSRGLTGDVDLAALGDRGYRVDGAAAGDRAGSAVGGTPDMSGDGLPEVLLGAPEAAAGSGAAHVVWGVPPPASPAVSAAAPADGFRMTGAPGSRAGTAVAAIGAIGAGASGPHVAVGAPGPAGSAAAGAVHVVAGRADAAPLTLPDHASLSFAGRGLGPALAAAGDVDGDGSADLLAGAPADTALARRNAGSAFLLLIGRVTPPGLDTAVLGAAGVRLAGPVHGAATGHALAGGVDAGGDGAPDALLAHRRVSRARGGASLVLLPPPDSVPGEEGLNVEVVIDDSRAMREGDPGGALRRGALQLLLLESEGDAVRPGVVPRRVVGAVEFGGTAREILPPGRVEAGEFDGQRIDVLGRLAERSADGGSESASLAAGLSAAAASNPAADAHIVVAGPDVDDVPETFAVQTFVLAVDVPAAVAARLANAARASSGALYRLPAVSAVPPALAAVSARLRGEQVLPTEVVGRSADELALGRTEAPVITELPASAKEVVFRGVVPRSRRQAGFVLQWDSAETRFDPVHLRFGRGRLPPLVVNRRDLRRALARDGEWVRARGRLEVSAHRGDTFVTVDVRGLRLRARRAGAPRATPAASRRGSRARAKARKRKGNRTSSVSPYLR